MATIRDLIEVFKDTQRSYRSSLILRKAIEYSISNTEIIAPGFTTDLQKRYVHTDIVVNSNRSFEDARSMNKADPAEKICVHNFASFEYPGGGVVNGSRAQEESLCRVSTLYPVLTSAKLMEKYYLPHHINPQPAYSDACIYSPDIINFKSDEDLPQLMEEKDWIKADVITCAAPNLRTYSGRLLSPEDQYAIHVQRARQILNVAAAHQVDYLVLGAFGCGAFSNNPTIVAHAYKKVVPEYDGVFKEIHFAVYTNPRGLHGDKNYTVFNNVMEK